MVVQHSDAVTPSMGGTAQARAEEASDANKSSVRAAELREHTTPSEAMSAHMSEAWHGIERLASLEGAVRDVQAALSRQADSVNELKELLRAALQRRGEKALPEMSASENPVSKGAAQGLC